MEDQLDELRRRAEQLLQGRQYSPELAKIQHELEVYQAELEIQNEELRDTQLALAASHDRYARLYDWAPVGYMTLSSQGLIRETNLTLANMLDVPRESLIGVAFRRFVRPSHHEMYQEFLNRLLHTGASPPCELAVYHPQHEDLHVQLDGSAVRDEQDRVTQLHITLTDITQRVRAEHAQERSAAWVRSIFEDSAMGIAVVDAGGRILSSNPALQEMLGYSADELEGLTFADITHPDDVAASIEAYRALIAGQGDRYQLEKRYMRRDGATVWGLLSVSRVRRVPGAPPRAIKTLQDITGRKHMQAALLQSEKLAVTGRMAASIAHEMNNPLQAIISNLELVKDFALGPEEEEHHLQICLDELVRLSHITRRVLDFTRLSQQASRLVPAGELLEQALALMSKELEHSNVSVDLDVPSGLPPVRIVTDHMNQVLVNILVNALDAMPAGGRIEIAARSADDHLNIGLSNNGPPIPDDQLGRIFEPFFSTKSDGNGLGLFISHNIVQRYGGMICAENLPEDQGVRFTIRLPIASPDADGSDGSTSAP